MTSASQTRKFPRWIVIVPLTFVGLTVLLLTPWAISLIDPVKTPDKCAFNSVTEDEYQHLLVQAKAQQWTVWPDLSNGIFWPSTRGPRPRGKDWESEATPKLLAYIRQLVPPESRSADRELAAAHALMRSIGAELVRVSDVSNSHGSSRIHF
jgi:hypothetical protein